MSEQSADTRTEKFISQMIEETGCSVKFLNEAKPIILKLFRDTTGAAQEQCLASVVATIKSQASIERLNAVPAARGMAPAEPALVPA